MPKLIVANWKMYLTLRESVALAHSLRSKLSFQGKLSFSVVLCPSFVAMEEVAKVLRGTRIKLGAQDVEPEKRGAFTGEVGLDDLRSLHVEYVLVGHSERRRYFGETDAVINRKLHAVLKAGMRPILCVGELKRPLAIDESNHPAPLLEKEGKSVRRRGNPRGRQAARKYVEKQLRMGLKGVSRKDLSRVVIAYEPVWAIGTGRPDTPRDASGMHEFIRKALPKLSFVRRNRTKLSFIPILYGGSVNAANAATFLRTPGVDGLLIGRASARAAEFRKILSLC